MTALGFENLLKDLKDEIGEYRVYMEAIHKQEGVVKKMVNYHGYIIIMYFVF